jgi:hypothetical protein
MWALLGIVLLTCFSARGADVAFGTLQAGKTTTDALTSSGPLLSTDGIHWTNTYTGAWGFIGTNSHVIFHDECGSEMRFWTNKFSVTTTNGHSMLWTNGSFYLDGSAIIPDNETNSVNASRLIITNYMGSGTASALVVMDTATNLGVLVTNGGAFLSTLLGTSNLTASQIANLQSTNGLGTNASALIGTLPTAVLPSIVVTNDAIFTNNTALNGLTIDATVPYQLYVTNATYTIAGFSGLQANMQHLVSVTVSNSSGGTIYVTNPSCACLFGSGSTNPVAVAEGKESVMSFWIRINARTNTCSVVQQ